MIPAAKKAILNRIIGKNISISGYVPAEQLARSESQSDTLE